MSLFDDAKLQRFLQLRNTFCLFSVKKSLILDLNQAVCAKTTQNLVFFFYFGLAAGEVTTLNPYTRLSSSPFVSVSGLLTFVSGLLISVSGLLTFVSGLLIPISRHLIGVGCGCGFYI